MSFVSVSYELQSGSYILRMPFVLASYTSQGYLRSFTFGKFGTSKKIQISRDFRSINIIHILVIQDKPTSLIKILFSA